MQIRIDVANKVARAREEYQIVCSNNDYTVLFSFDHEWDEYEVKTARFNFTKNGVRGHHDVVFSGCECNVPALSGIKSVEIGVYAGDLHTTTPCLLKYEKSVLCDSGAPKEPEPNVYAEIMGKCNEAVNTANEVKEQANRGEFDGYTPKKGVDYYTEADKTEMVRLVLAALPDGDEVGY